MVVEKNSDRFNRTGEVTWAPQARRQGEGAAWAERAPSYEQGDSELGAATTLPLQRWPRVFPGI